MDYGQENGEVCGRKGCSGVIAEHESESGCSCHINPPCSACTDDRHYCPECDWSGRDEQTVHMNGYVCKVDKSTGVFNSWKLRELDNSEIDWHSFSHSNSSMRKKGVYPEGATQKEVLAKVEGTFGGRFEQFGNGTFDYIAYTD